MKSLTTLFLFFSFFGFSQLTANFTASNLCDNDITPNDLVFSAVGGTAPYTFVYNVDGGVNDTITTTSGTSVSPDTINTAAGTYVYTLVSVWDVSMTPQTIGTDYTITIQPTPVISGMATTCPGETVQFYGSGTASLSTPWTTSSPAIATISSTGTATGINPGTTVVSYTNSFGCTATTTLSVFVAQVVFADAGFGAGVGPVVCYGTPVEIVGVGGMNYSWSGPNGFIGTSPNLNLQNLTAGTITYTMNAVDQNGCYAYDQVVVTVIPSDFVNAGPDQIICNGATATLAGTATGIATYTWSLDGTNVSSASEFTVQPSPGTYTYVLTGSMNGCTDMDEVTVTVSPTVIDPVVEIDSVQCGYGGIYITNTESYSFVWSNGSTMSSVQNAAAGVYNVSITDNLSGCNSQFSYTLPVSIIPGNCGEISGYIVYDGDENCAISSGDIPMANRLISITPGNLLTTTNQNGFYSIELPMGTYTVSEVINNSYYGNFCNPSYSATLVNDGDSIGDNNFYDTLTGGIDKGIYVISGSVVPGFNFYVWPYFSAMGIYGTNALLDGSEAWIAIPQGAVFQSFGYPHTISNDTIYFTLNSGFYTVPLIFTASDIALGSLVSICGGVAPASGETILVNNTHCYQTTAVGSFDPNDKRMFVNGVQSNSTIELEDEKLDYVVRFQNTGTAPAHDIFILDTISPNLDLSTFEFITSSHTCHVSILEDNVLRFDFPQIFLADSNANEPESHGFFHYSIHQNPDNVLGDVIENTAYIYFDFNEAVVTNTTFDSIVEQGSSIAIQEQSLEGIKLFPNPTNGVLNIESDTQIETVQVLSPNGYVVEEYQMHSKTAKIDLSRLTHGVYFIQMNSANGKRVRRVVVQ